MRLHQVTVIGASDDTESYKESYEIGKYIAKKGHVIITGGKGGVMEAVSKGASEYNGIVIGLLPGDNYLEANKFCNIVIPTGIGYARNIVNILAADVVIAIGGKSGTLCELAYAWQYSKPVICCTFADGWSRKILNIKIDDRKGSRLYIAETVSDACKHLDDILN